MFRQVQIRTIAVFLSGVVVGVAGIVFLGGGRHQTTAPAARAADQKETAQADQKEASQIGRYQAFTFKMEVPNSYAGLIDTSTGKVWSLQAFADAPKYRWVAMADGPK
jgi:hypothetical protein